MAINRNNRLPYSRFINPIERFINGVEDTDEDEDEYGDSDDNEVVFLGSSDDSTTVSSIHADTDEESTNMNYIDEWDDTHFQLENEYDNILDNIYEEDRIHMDSEKQDGAYYLGIYKYMKKNCSS